MEQIGKVAENMKLRKIIGYSDKLLRGQRMRLTLLCAALAGAELLFRLSEASVYGIMLYFGKLQPAELFSDRSPIKLISAAGFTIMRYAVTAPLIYAAAYRTTGICTDNRKMRDAPLSGIILSRQRFRRSIGSLLISKAVGAVLCIPAIFFGTAAVRIISDGTDSPAALFMAVHGAAMTVFSAGLWVWAKLALMCVPYIMVRNTEISSFTAARDAFRLVKGRRGSLLKIILFYAPQGIFIFTAPLAMTGIFSAAALCTDIFIKEDEYLERNDNDCRFKRPRHAPVISAWTEGIFKKASDPTETH